MTNLPISNQAQWMLNGRWPVRETPAAGCGKPEPSAMASLVTAGLAVFVTRAPILGGNEWRLTDAGRAAKAGAR